VRTVDPDLVHLHSAKAGLAGRLALRGMRPTIYQPHAWSFEAAGGMAPAVAAWERWAARWADLIVCVSEDERTRGEASGVDARYAVAVNGVEVEALHAVDAEGRRRARRSLGSSEAPLAVLVGRLDRQKGVDLLLDAWHAVRVAAANEAPSRDGPRRA
jgi:glycosyltransferase involved in cell wall biosynthesis